MKKIRKFFGIVMLFGVLRRIMNLFRQMAQNETRNTFNRSINTEPFALRCANVEMLFDLCNKEREVICIDVEVFRRIRGARNVLPLDESDYTDENVDNRFDYLILLSKAAIVIFHCAPRMRTCRC